MRRIIAQFVKYFDRLFRLKYFEPAPGIWFEPTGAGSYRYHSGDYSANIEGELLVGAIDIVIYAYSLSSWMPPHEQEPLTDQKRREIVADLCKVLEHYNRKYDIQW